MKNEIRIKKFIVTTGWRWKIDEETCGICQQEFELMCMMCSHPLECGPCIGVCSHTYHHHCVKAWLKKHDQCPMCREEWKYEKIYEIKKER